MSVIHLVPAPELEPQESCIDILEQMLERARCGEIVSVFVVGATREGAITGWAHPDTAQCNRHGMLGAIELGKHDYMQEAFEHA